MVIKLYFIGDLN